MRCIVTKLLAVFSIILLTSASVHAQSAVIANKLGTETNAETSDFAKMMQEAAENGVSVIVVDTEGTPLSQPTTSDQNASQDSDEIEGMSGLMEVQVSAVEFRKILLERLNSLPGSFEEVSYILRANSPDGRIWTYVSALLWSILFLGIGYLVEREIYGKRIIPRLFELPTVENPVGYTEKLPFLVSRFLLRASGVLVSMVVAFIIGTTLFGELPNEAMQFTVTLINVAYLACRLVALLWRMILSPFANQYRIPKFTDKSARRLYRWLWGTAVVDICAVVFSVWLFELGLTYDVFALFTAIPALFVVALNIAMITVNHNAISRAIRNGQDILDVALLGRFVSKAWAPLAIIYFLFAWVELTYRLVLNIPLSTPLIMGAYVILTTIIVVFGVINYLIERFFHRASVLDEINSAMQDEEATAEASDEGVDGIAKRLVPFQHPLSNFEDLARRVAGILAFVAGLWALTSIWNVNDNMLESDAFFTRGIDVIVILFIGYIIYHTFRIWIDSKIEEETGDEVEVEPGDEGGASGASRLATLLPLFRNFILIVVVVTIVLIVLLEIGINVSPLFAGAGIAGLAIGFGAQTLVRDIFSGAFFLVDDAFRKGEYIDVGSVKGTVEKISVRSFQLRHHLGPLHTIPFGEIQVLTNFSRDWVMMKLPLRVTYDTDVEKVRKLIKKLGLELMDDPVIGDNFLQPLKSQGVIEMQDSAMIIRVKFMTKPGDQWVIRKRVFQEIRDLFIREGIQFAHKQVTVRLADEDSDRELTEAQKKAIAGAAQASIIEDEEEQNENGE